MTKKIFLFVLCVPIEREATFNTAVTLIKKHKKVIGNLWFEIVIINHKSQTINFKP
jgi:hypothetical protein